LVMHFIRNPTDRQSVFHYSRPLVVRKFSLVCVISVVFY
jgi:hypothetical protein